MNRKLIALFYILVRDQIPAGDLIKIINDVKDLEDIQFTNPHLFALAEDLVNRLAKDGV